MTITIFQPLPNVPIGPGINVNVSSDFIGPFPTGTLWQIQVFSQTTIERVIASWSEDYFAGGGNFIHWGTRAGGRAGLAESAAHEADPVNMEISLLQAGTTVVDQVTQPQTWSPSSNLTAVIQAQQGSSSGGFTDSDRALLNQVSVATEPNFLLDALTTIELSPGITPGPVNAFLTDSTWGILVRIHSLPPDFVSHTPDADYFFPSLAVVRLFRGSDLWKRIPIHTSSKLISFVDESVVAGVTLATSTQWLLNMSVQVNFAAGVTGQVFKLRFP